jgi:hypothetical protein
LPASSHNNLIIPVAINNAMILCVMHTMYTGVTAKVKIKSSKGNFSHNLWISYNKMLSIVWGRDFLTMIFNHSFSFAIYFSNTICSHSFWIMAPKSELVILFGELNSGVLDWWFVANERVCWYMEILKNILTLWF